MAEVVVPLFVLVLRKARLPRIPRGSANHNHYLLGLLRLADAPVV